MKKIYIAPELLVSEIQEQTIIAQSVGLSDGDPVGNQKPEGDDDENFFVKGNNSTWSEW